MRHRNARLRKRAFFDGENENEIVTAKLQNQ